MTNNSKIRVRPRGRMRKTVLAILYQENASVTQAWLRGFVRYAKTANWHVETLAYAGELREFWEAREAVRYLTPDGVVSACCSREFAHCARSV